MELVSDIRSLHNCRCFDEVRVSKAIEGNGGVTALLPEMFEERESISREFAECVVLEHGVPQNEQANWLVHEWICDQKVAVDLLNGAAATAVSMEQREEVVVVALSTRHFIKHLPPNRLNKSKKPFSF